MKKLFTIILYTLLAAACTSGNGKQQNKADSPASTRDTSANTALPYWDSTKDRYRDAYIDTFSIEGNNFRFVNPVASIRKGDNIVTLQQIKDGQWQDTKIILHDNIHGANIGRGIDINSDGFKDIYNTTRYTADVYLFNPATHTFSDTPIGDFNLDFYKLDSVNHIYCDFQEFKRICGDIHTTLYTFKGLDKYSLYDVELYNCDTTYNTDSTVASEWITQLILSKCINGHADSTTVIQTEKLDKPINIYGADDNGKYPNGTDEYFDYKAYWRSRYKALLQTP